MKLTLTLNYTLPEGELSPYFDALRNGRALASRCAGCGWLSFPARVRCEKCGTGTHDWVELSGKARVIFRTDGVAASHALVRFDGADGATLVALQNPEEINEGGRLVVPQGERPGLWLRLDGED
ncbi:MAG: zinc ribbon domain-containing protein [Hoeflea sp.]|uniref:Zn-ribbon domain-containing OB-fold protein n=1 Tax=Hoeflea sp. TaxID=1940281 RepID=UPI003298EC2E|tara:strand:+ start:2824 stop:3195 length:372 start_codon:yes stop_codon:yes gene_type:complete